MIRVMIFFSFFIILLGNEKISKDTLTFPKLDLRDGTFILDKPIDLKEFFEKNSLNR